MGGLEKLKRTRVKASRGTKVACIPALQRTHSEYETRCAPGKTLSSWGLASFTTKDEIARSEDFIGPLGEPGFVYECPQLEGVDVSKLSMKPKESEILPLPPLLLR